MQFWMFPWDHEAFDFFHRCQEREGSYIGGWFAAAAIGTERLSVLEDLREVWAKYLDRDSYMVFPGSAGVSPAPKAARMAALPGCKLPEHNSINIMSGYLSKRLWRNSF